MDWMLSGLILGSVVAGGFLAGVAIHLVGGTGVARKHTRELRALADDIDALDGRITRDQNRRKGEQSVVARAEKKTITEMQEIAAARLAATPKTAEPIVPGFSSMFKNG